MHKTIIIKRAMTGKYDHSGTVIVSQISDQHPDLSLMFPGPGIPRQNGTASEPSDMSLPPSGMSSPRASRRRTPFSLSDLC